MPIYEFENIKTGERIEEMRALGDTTPPKGYMRVFIAGILSRPGGTVGKFKKHRSRSVKSE